MKVLDELVDGDGFPLLRSLQNQWQSWDLTIYLLRHMARAFSSHEHFTEMVNITGAKNSGKSPVVTLILKFLEDGRMNSQLGSTRTTDKDGNALRSKFNTR